MLFDTTIPTIMTTFGIGSETASRDE